jgi:hypothetical protein
MSGAPLGRITLNDLRSSRGSHSVLTPG